MSEERQDEFFRWKEKLDELHQLPGAGGLDKTAAWEKLHARLGSGSRKRKVLWYWSAAACLLLILGSQWLGIKQDTNVVQSIKEPQQEKLSQNKLIASKDKVVGTPVQTSSPKQYVIKREMLKGRPQSQQITVVKHTLIAETTPVNEPHPDMLSRTDIKQDSLSVIAAIPLKKKLRVIHINELGPSLEEENDVARSMSTRAVSPKTLNQHLFRGLTGSRNASDDILKIKLSPSN